MGAVQWIGNNKASGTDNITNVTRVVFCGIDSDCNRKTVTHLTANRNKR